MALNAESEELAERQPILSLLPQPRPKRRPAWIATASVGVAGLIACSALGVALMSTMSQRDSVNHQLKATQSAQAALQQKLDVAQASVDAAQASASEQKVIDDYTQLYVAQSARIGADYWALTECGSYGECRTVSQEALGDLQGFQSARNAAAVPAQLASADAALRDGLSAAIQADQELIAGFDNDNVSQAKDGAKKYDAAMFSIAKAETALGQALATASA